MPKLLSCYNVEIPFKAYFCIAESPQKDGTDIAQWMIFRYGATCALAQPPLETHFTLESELSYGKASPQNQPFFPHFW